MRHSHEVQIKINDITHMSVRVSCVVFELRSPFVSRNTPARVARFHTRADSGVAIGKS